MCNPAAALFAAAGTLDFIEQRGAAKHQQEWQDTQYKRTKALAIKDSIASYSALQARQREEEVLSTRETGKVLGEALKAMGTARVQGGTGGSAAAVYGDITRQAVEFQGGMVLRQRAIEQQTGRSLEAVERKTLGTLQAAQLPDVPMPSFLGAALRIGSGAALTYHQTKPKT